jgi:hypothetical protein
MQKQILIRLSKIATAVAFLFVIGAITVKPARADDDHHHRGGPHHEEHHRFHGRGGPYIPPVPDYYYAPPANYYTAPEPSYYYAPQPVYSEPAPPSQGISLFFGY